MSDDFIFEVRDKEIIGSRMIASTSIKASALCGNGFVRDWFTVLRDGHSAG